MAGGEAARPGIFGGGEKLPDRIEGLQIRDGIGTRRSTDGRLIDKDDVADVLRAFELSMEADAAVPVTLRTLHGCIEDVVHQRALAGSANAGNAHEQPERNLDVDLFEIVLGGTEDAKLLTGGPAS